jgi:putative salt-induced outer membrane protein
MTLKGHLMKIQGLLLSTVVLLALTPAAFAQTGIIGIDAIDDDIDDIQRETREDIDDGQDDRRFGPGERQEGFSGSAALSFSSIDAINDETDVSFAARLNDNRGPFSQTLGVVLTYSDVEEGESGDQRDLFFIYDATYDFNDRFYGFVLARGLRDGLADEADENEVDAFVGIGPGYRIINTPTTAWRLQAGVGVSYLEDGVGNDDTEFGVIASSRLYVQFNDNIFMTNDTDVLNSDSALRANNDLGINFQVSDQVSTRLSYLTDYNDSREDKTENRLGVSLVYGF